MKIYIKIIFILSAIIILGLNTYSQELPNYKYDETPLEFTSKTSKAIVGKCPNLGIYFSSVLKKKGHVVIDIKLGNRNQLIGHIDYEKETFQIKFISLKTKALVKLSAEDKKKLSALTFLLSKHPELYDSKGVGDALNSTLALLYGYPAGELLDLYDENSGQ